MKNLTLKAAETPYEETINKLRFKLVDAIEEGRLEEYLSKIDLEIYFGLVDSYLNVFYHYFYNLREQEHWLTHFFKEYLNSESKRLELEQIIRNKTVELEQSCAQFAYLQLNYLIDCIDQIETKNSDELIYDVGTLAVGHVFYENTAMVSISPIPTLVTTCKTGIIYLLLKEVKEFKERYPYLQIMAHEKSKHRCTTHHELFGKLYEFENPIWHQILPANGIGCKCEIWPQNGLTKMQIQKETSFEPDANKNAYKPFMSFNCIEDQMLFHALKVNPVHEPVLLYKKGFSKERELSKLVV
ncbi:MAG: hypothetical protein KDC92_01230 [Bacteroidetes bacterium]|nr:hypothetical protein [Bacteroidota bacterium]